MRERITPLPGVFETTADFDGAGALTLFLFFNLLYTNSSKLNNN